MKKLAVILLLLALVVFSSSAMAQNQGYLEAKLGLDFMGEIDIETEDDEDVDSGVTLTGEYKLPMDNVWTYGAGLSYQLDREVDDSNGDEFNFTPIYALAQYDLEDSSTYLVGHLGYNIFDGDRFDDYNGGLYYGFGAGFLFGETGNYTAEFLYSVNNGEVEDGSDTHDVDYS
ncbi:MAG: outer membrane beta-barrel protein, partial [Halanaerobium sp.]